MILILSTPTDLDTQNVIEWLAHYKSEFFRLNDEDLISGRVEFHYDLNIEHESFFQIDTKKILISDISIVWFRKFGFLKSFESKLGKNSDIVKYLYSEFKVLRDILFRLLDHKKWLYKKNNMLNKLEILKEAKYNGLNVPETRILTRKKELSRFIDQYGSILTKSLGEGKHVVINKLNYPFFTKKIEDVNGVTDFFGPTLFQKYIDKEIELRIFYLEGEFFTMAIFSQNNPKTIIDFRSYDYENPTRYVPFLLPKSIENKLHNLMTDVGLNTGSIDMIRCKKGEYHFLEVNPAGQFGMTSVPCNYSLHKKIAEHLIKHSNNYAD